MVALRVLRARSWAPSRLAFFGLATVAYSLLALSAYELFGAVSVGVTFFPPAGLTFAAFLLLERRFWPPMVAAVVVGEVLVDMGQGQGFWWSLGWAGANLSEPLVGAAVARRIVPDPQLDRRFALAFLVGGLVAGPIVGASIGATVLAVADDLAWLSSWADVFVGDALGVLVVAPCIIVLARPDEFAPSAPRRADPVVVVVAMVAASVLLFRTDSIPAGYAVVPLLALTAMRYGPAEVSIASVVVAASLTAATARGFGPWGTDDGIGDRDQLLEQQIFLLVAILGAWLLKLEVRERAAAVRAAELSQLALERANQRAREQRHLTAMHEALREMSGAHTTESVAAAAIHHARLLFDTDAVALLLTDPRSGQLATLAATGEPIDGGWPTVASAVDGSTDAERPVFGFAVSDGCAALPFHVGRDRRGVVLVRRPAEIGWSEGAQVRAMAFTSIVADALERTEQAAVDRQIALTLQKALMPEEVRTPAGLEVAGRYLPASESLEVGGDWYDVVVAADGLLATVVIGDVVGHSLQAAAAMGKLASAARALAYARLGPADLLDVLDIVAGHTPNAIMTSAICASVCPGTGELRYAVAGHPPPILVDPVEGPRLLDGGRATPLAVASPRGRQDAVVALAPGSFLFFYTDGLVERRDEPIDEGIRRLVQVLGAVAAETTDPAAACDRVTAALLPDEGHADDVAVLCLHVAAV